MYVLDARFEHARLSSVEYLDALNAS